MNKTMTSYQLRKERSKEVISQAAIELFKLHGIKKVSISDIANKAHVTPATIYNHFGNRDQLIRKVLKSSITSFAKKYTSLIESDLPFIEKLERITLEKNEYRGLLQGLPIYYPDTYRLIKDAYEENFYPLMDRFFKQGRKEGYLNSNASTKAILIYTEIFQRGVAASPELADEITSDAKIMKEISSLYLYGLIKQSGKDITNKIKEEAK
jgi:AcrR family transcriptional regulator